MKAVICGQLGLNRLGQGRRHDQGTGGEIGHAHGHEKFFWQGP